MAAKFTGGNTGTRTVQKGRSVSEPETHSHDGPGHGNTLNGMPGYINAHESESMGHARGGKGVGPKREGPIGKRGSPGAKALDKASPGTSVRSYHASSTGKSGGEREPNETGSHHIHTKTRGKMPGQKEPPTSTGSITGKKVGIDMARHREKNDEAAGMHRLSHGHRGRMERLSGTAKTHAEGRRKSVMY